MNRYLLFIVLLAASMSACSQSPHALSADEFEKRLSTTKDVQLIDVRTPAEYKKGHIEGAVNINVSSTDFEERISKLDKTKPVMVYCLSGGRSAKAAAYMRKNGFDPVLELKGGMMQWNAKGKPAVSGGGPSGMKTETFHEKVNQDYLVLVDFYATWCGPCKKMAPDLEALKQEYAGKMILMKVDADANTTLVSDLKVDALPTLHLYKNGKAVWSHVGYLGKREIKQQIVQHL